MPETVANRFDTERDLIAPPGTIYGDNDKVPVPPTTPWSVIEAASNQISAGQPVTALPRQEWSAEQGQSFAARLNAFDQQAKAAKDAAQQAAIDARMLDQMSRVAKSAKDIEIARRSIDVMALQRDIQNGVPIHQAVQRHPMALGSGFAGALRASEPAPVPTKLELPGMPPAVQIGRNVQFPPAPPISLMQPEARTAQPITTPDNKVIGYDIGGGKTISQPKLAEGKLTDQQKARLTDLRKQRDVLTKEMSDFTWEGRVRAGGPENEKYVADKTSKAQALDDEIARIEGVEPTRAAKPVAVLGQGTKDDPAKPKTNEEFASLPSKAWFINPKDGKLMQKK